MFYIYILYSPSSDSTYIGYGEDPWARLIDHNAKEEGTSSSKHKHWELKAVFETVSKTDAIEIERFIKKQKSKKLMDKLMNPEFNLEGKLAQLVRVPHVRD